MAESTKSVMVLVNSCWNVLNFRQELIERYYSLGYRVFVVAPEDDSTSRLAAHFEFIPLTMQQRSISPISDALLIARYMWLFYKFKPDFILSFTIKPNIFGSIAAWLCGSKIVLNVTGLGSGFSGSSQMTKILNRLYLFCFSKSYAIFFQNSSDYNTFAKNPSCYGKLCTILPGSGVCLERFQVDDPGQPRAGSDKFVFLLAARLLESKGVSLFLEAAEELKRVRNDVEFWLIGIHESENGYVPLEQIVASAESGHIKWFGRQNDIEPWITASSCCVLPSIYREGTPKFLLEGLACGKPIITLDRPGCRDVLRDGVNGFFLSDFSVTSLCNAMNKILALSKDELSQFGRSSRKLAERKYDVNIVVERYLSATHNLPRSVCISVNKAWNIHNFRTGLVSAISSFGKVPILMAGADAYCGGLAADNLLVSFPIDATGTSIWGDSIYLFQLMRFYKQYKPSEYYSFTAKPNVYGAIVFGRNKSCFAGMNVSGLGSVFTAKSSAGLSLRWLYKLACRRSGIIFFQNRSDAKLFRRLKIHTELSKTAIVPGSGINIAKFEILLSKYPGNANTSRRPGFVFLYLGRLLKDKGLFELLEAAERLNAEGVCASIRVVGNRVPGHPQDVGSSWFKKVNSLDYFEVLPHTEVVAGHFNSCDAVVLPSYREGLPRVLLEGAIAEKILIATKVAGCRDIVEHLKTGLLANPRDADSLKKCMQLAMTMSSDEKRFMAMNAKNLVAHKYSEDLVVKIYEKFFNLNKEEQTNTFS